MARIIGRKACPWCGFQAAHIKQSDGKHPYHHCPDCGIMTHAKNGAQAKLIAVDLRHEPDYINQQPRPPETADPIIVKGVIPQAGPKADETPPPPKRAGLWDQLMGAQHGA